MILSVRSNSRSQAIGVFLVWCLGMPGLDGGQVGADELRRAVAGVVIDEAARPVADAGVELVGYPESRFVRTDGAGRFAFPDAELGGWSVATVLARSNDGRLGFGVFNQDQLHSARLVLKPARSIRVRVVDGANQPVTGAEILISAGYTRIAGGVSDAQGNWTGSVPTDVTAWKCFARQAKVGFDYAQAERARGSTEPLLPWPESVTMTLDGARAPIRVRAVDLKDQPLAGIKVGIWLIQKPGKEDSYNFAGPSGQTATTDVDGVATLDWIPERVESLAIVTRSQRFVALDHAVFLQQLATGGEVKIPLVPIERLAGQVVDRDGQPVPGAVVSATGQGSGSTSYRRETTTDAAGRYHFDAYSEAAYILTATKGDQAAPYRADVVLRAGQPLDEVDLRLGPATRLRGQVTLAAAGTPVADQWLQVSIDRGQIPAELRRAGDRFYRSLSATLSPRTDHDGRYEILLGPGDYTLRGVTRLDPIQLSIPTTAPPAELVQNLVMPRPDQGPFELTVVDHAGKPVARAKVEGTYISEGRWTDFRPQTTNDAGVAAYQRSLDPMIVNVESPDRSLAGLTRFEVETTAGKIIVAPSATATGRLVDPRGQPRATTEFSYGIKVHQGNERNSPFSWYFGGKVRTDTEGRFSCPGLVVGQSYDFHTYLEGQSHVPSTSNAARPTSPGPMALGDVIFNLAPPKPYVPPTAAERTTEAFAAAKRTALSARLTTLLAEAKREYTRPMILLGAQDAPACVELFRLFNEYPETAGATDQPKPKTPADLRWEFELAALDATQPDVLALATDLGVDARADAPVLVVLNGDGKPAASYPIRLGADAKLDAPALTGFLLQHKLITRDAEAMLGAAQKQARAEEKRVFLIFSASWCGPCRLLARFLATTHAELDPHFVFVKLDISRDAHAADLQQRFPDSASSGVPWFVILDAAGQPLIDSNATKPRDGDDNPNIGFPSSPEAINHFLKMLAQTAPNLTPAARELIRSKLAPKP